MLHNRETMTLKQIFLQELEAETLGETEIGICLSSGIDSNTLLFGLLELGLKPTAYSFHVDGVMSTDFVTARQNAKTFGVPFKEIIIPQTINIEYIYKIFDSGLYKKTSVECLYPFLYLIPEVTQKILLTAHDADTHFGISKKAMIHHRATLELKQQYVAERLIYPKAKKQTQVLQEWCQELGISTDTPYNKKPIIDYFYPLTWDELNKPTQKHPLKTMFPEQTKKIKPYPHINLQCGDSYLREIFEPLLKTNLNKRNRTRTIDLYRDMYKEHTHA